MLLLLSTYGQLNFHWRLNIYLKVPVSKTFYLNSISCKVTINKIKNKCQLRMETFWENNISNNNTF